MCKTFDNNVGVWQNSHSPHFLPLLGFAKGLPVEGCAGETC